jgi:hypothetical protein
MADPIAVLEFFIKQAIESEFKSDAVIGRLPAPMRALEVYFRSKDIFVAIVSQCVISRINPIVAVPDQENRMLRAVLYVLDDEEILCGHSGARCCNLRGMCTILRSIVAQASAPILCAQTVMRDRILMLDGATSTQNDDNAVELQDDDDDDAQDDGMSLLFDDFDGDPYGASTMPLDEEQSLPKTGQQRAEAQDLMMMARQLAPRSARDKRRNAHFELPDGR